MANNSMRRERGRNAAFLYFEARVVRSFARSIAPLTYARYVMWAVDRNRTSVFPG